MFAAEQQYSMWVPIGLVLTVYNFYMYVRYTTNNTPRPRWTVNRRNKKMKKDE